MIMLGNDCCCGMGYIYCKCKYNAKLHFQDDQSVLWTIQLLSPNKELFLQRNANTFLFIGLLFLQSFCTVTKYHDTCPREPCYTQDRSATHILKDTVRAWIQHELNLSVFVGKTKSYLVLVSNNCIHIETACQVSLFISCLHCLLGFILSNEPAQSAVIPQSNITVKQHHS